MNGVNVFKNLGIAPLISILEKKVKNNIVAVYKVNDTVNMDNYKFLDDLLNSNKCEKIRSHVRLLIFYYLLDFFSSDSISSDSILFVFSFTHDESISKLALIAINEQAIIKSFLLISIFEISFHYKECNKCEK